jgi:hypothetical protein
MHPECTCPHVVVDHEVYPATAWSDRCPVHGVGTDYFRALKHLPFGFAEERDTTREEWLEFVAQGGEDAY